MKRAPPYLVRRLVWHPLFVVATVALFSTLPDLGAGGGVRIAGRSQAAGGPLRVAWFLFVYLFYESLMLVVLFVLWVASGFGWKTRCSPGSRTSTTALPRGGCAESWAVPASRSTSVSNDDDPDGTQIGQTCPNPCSCSAVMPARATLSS